MQSCYNILSKVSTFQKKNYETNKQETVTNTQGGKKWAIQTAHWRFQVLDLTETSKSLL